jgi:nitrite reductase/ring-hydroxylating ferredoxin subunit
MFGARRFLENLLRQRRTRRLRVDPETDAELRTAILLRSARVGADSVREEFVSSLHQRLANELDGPATPVPLARRRVIVGLGATAAASAAVGAGLGAGLDHVLAAGAVAAAPDDVQSELSPDNGVWTTVAASVDLPDGSSVRFDLGTITGFVSRGNGRLWAVSGICTHLGCRLNLDAPTRQLDCPCHGASFSLTGAVMQHRLPVPLQPLPEIAVREMNGAVQVFAPPRQGN